MPEEVGVARKKRENDGTLIPGRIRNLGSGSNGVAAHANANPAPGGGSIQFVNRLDPGAMANSPSSNAGDSAPDNPVR